MAIKLLLTTTSWVYNEVGYAVCHKLFFLGFKEEEEEVDDFGHAKKDCETLLVTLDCDFGLVGIPVLPKRYDDGW